MGPNVVTGLWGFHIQYTGVTDGKATKWKKNEKKKPTNTGHLIFSYTIHLDTA